MSASRRAVVSMKNWTVETGVFVAGKLAGQRLFGGTRSGKKLLPSFGFFFLLAVDESLSITNTSCKTKDGERRTTDISLLSPWRMEDAIGRYFVFSNSSSIYSKTSRSKPHIIIRSIAKMVVAKVCQHHNKSPYHDEKSHIKPEKKKKERKKERKRKEKKI